MAGSTSAPVVVITGASSGIGQATAETFARRGAQLVLAARSTEALERVAQRCRDLGGTAIAVPTDVTDSTAVAALLQRALGVAGRIDVWFSNVGVGAVGRFQDVPLEVHRQVVQANLIGHMIDAHAVVPVFLRQGRGVFISMNSMGAYLPAPYAASYTAGKFGLRGFTAALRAELADHPQIHICEVYPLFVDTPGIPHAANYTGRKLRIGGTMSDPWTVARAVVRLSQKPRPSLTIGSAAWILRAGHVLVPQLAVNLAAAFIRRALERAEPAPCGSGNVLGPPARPGGVEGGLRRSGGGGAILPLAVLAGAAAFGLIRTGRSGIASRRHG
ncbi:SDR family oxidoreductase [Plastorhodobacter daqingensis]|uniref:SDR family oxidoreductase n=1 Tax=Plastorhodobacter daqingensis TaxID=1387281 RepID=A0ABW2UJ82_9RHOB